MNKTIRLLLFFMLFASSSANAGTVFRFLDPDDPDGNTTIISQNLPHYAIRMGYDILDSKTLRIIEKRLPLTNDQLAEQNRLLNEKIALEKQVAIDEKEAKAKIQKQADRTKKLIAIYGSKEALVERRDIDLAYYQSKIDQIMSLIKRSEKTYLELQKKIAEQEKNGQEISINLKMNLQTREKEMANNLSSVKYLTEKMAALDRQYEADLYHLRAFPLDKQTNQSIYP